MRKFLGYKGRSIWKGFIFQSKRNIGVKDRARNISINSADVGKVIYVYTGKEERSMRIKNKHVGFKFGQFFWTKRMGSASHLKTTNVKKKKK